MGWYLWKNINLIEFHFPPFLVVFRREGAVLLLALESVVGRQQEGLDQQDHRLGFCHLISDREEKKLILILKEAAQSIQKIQACEKKF